MLFSPHMKNNTHLPILNNIYIYKHTHVTFFSRNVKHKHKYNIYIYVIFQYQYIIHAKNQTLLTG